MIEIEELTPYMTGNSYMIVKICHEEVNAIFQRGEL